mmetsp:Transcript_25318/g.41656  ORF Transcript_25318/g.41656 Transcript_25318/m.41656 type:complete len:241 (+) Transcript_25318:1140-1862(+)
MGINTKESGRLTRRTDMEPKFGQTVLAMKDSGRLTRSQGTALTYWPMGINSKGLGWTVHSVAPACTGLPTGMCSRGTSSTTCSMGKEPLSGPLLETHMRGSGLMASGRGAASTCGRMDTCAKVIGTMARWWGKGPFVGLMAALMWGSAPMVSWPAEGCLYGRMDPDTRAHSRTATSMGKAPSLGQAETRIVENGRKGKCTEQGHTRQRTGRCTRVNGFMVTNRASDARPGPMVTRTRARL